MKISELEIGIVKQYLKINFADDDILLQLIIDGAKSYLKGYTGLDDTMLDAKEDLTIGTLALISDMYDSRSFIVEKDKVNKLIDNMLNMHSINLL